MISSVSSSAVPRVTVAKDGGHKGDDGGLRVVR